MNDIVIIPVIAGNSDNFGTDTLVDMLTSLEDECFGDEAWSRESICGFIANPAVVTVCATDTEIDKNTPVGAASAIVVCDEAEITKVAVTSRYRRRGIAKRMLRELERLLCERGVNRLLLEVREGNASARALYMSLGFTEYSRRRSYYKLPREDAVMMEKIISK